jgi:hypothetical protein
MGVNVARGIASAQTEMNLGTDRDELLMLKIGQILRTMVGDGVTYGSAIIRQGVAIYRTMQHIGEVNRSRTGA